MSAAQVPIRCAGKSRGELTLRAFVVSRHGGPEALEWTERPDPVPGPGEVRVRIRACALNRLDLWVRNGVPGHRFPLPLIPGSEVAGDVESVGPGVSGIEPGMPTLLAPAVSCGSCRSCAAGEDPFCRSYAILGEGRDGGYAEAIVVPVRNVLPLPNGLSYAEAAATPLVFLTAWQMLAHRARLRPQEDILIQAAGSGVSTAGIQIARRLGARHVIVTSSSPEKLERARELGATHGVDLRDEGWVREVRRITGGKGVEVVLEHVGGEVFEGSCAALARGGRLTLCGATAEGLAQLNLRAVFFKQLSILGSTMGRLADLHLIGDLLGAGHLRPVVDRTFPLEAAAAAQELLTRREQFGKIVLTVGDPEKALHTPLA